METYSPHHNNYEVLRELSEQQSIQQREQRDRQLDEQKTEEKRDQERKALEQEATEKKEQGQKAEEQRGQEQKEEAQAVVQSETTVESEQVPEIEPVRSEGHYGETRYKQGSGDYVSETTAARINDRMINSDYYASLQAKEAGDRDMAREAIENDVTKEQTGASLGGGFAQDEEINKLAEDYVRANPDSGATQDEIYEAAYFAKSVEDSNRYPPLNQEMKNQVEDRQAYEELGDVLRGVSDESVELSDEEEQEVMQERMQTHLSQQHSMSMA